MIYNFKTVSDGQQWAIDTERLSWAKASSILATPSVQAAQANIAQFVAQEEGRLIPIGGGRYSFDGRKPMDDKGVPQLSIIILLTVLSAEEDGACVTFLQGNVDVQDLQHQKINKFRCECLPAVKTPNRPV